MVKNKFTEKLIKELFSKYFKNITIYYQKKFSPSDILLSNFYLQKNKQKISIRKIVHKLYSLVDKDFNFFELHFKFIYLKLFPLKISKKQDFVPISNSNKSDYLYFIIVCNK